MWFKYLAVAIHYKNGISAKLEKVRVADFTFCSYMKNTILFAVKTIHFDKKPIRFAPFKFQVLNLG